MGLNDEAEKRRQADEWLASAPYGSEHWRAAFEYLGGTEIAQYTQTVALAHLESARCDITTITLAHMGRKMAWELLEKGGVPLALPRHEIEEHANTQWRDDPFSGLAVFRMWVPYRKVG